MCQILSYQPLRFPQGRVRPEHSLQCKDHSKLLSVLSPSSIFAGVTEGYAGYTNHAWLTICFIFSTSRSHKTLQISNHPPLFSARVNPCLLWKGKLLDQGLSTARIRKLLKQYWFLRDSVLSCNEMISISFCHMAYNSL